MIFLLLEMLSMKLAHLRDILEDRFEITLPELSMGMSEDLFDAISAGSTMIREWDRHFGGNAPSHV